MSDADLVKAARYLAAELVRFAEHEPGRCVAVLDRLADHAPGVRQALDHLADVERHDRVVRGERAPTTSAADVVRARTVGRTAAQEAADTAVLDRAAGRERHAAELERRALLDPRPTPGRRSGARPR